MCHNHLFRQVSLFLHSLCIISQIFLQIAAHVYGVYDIKSRILFYTNSGCKVSVFQGEFHWGTRFFQVHFKFTI